MTQKKLADCNTPGPIKDVNIDEPPPYCGTHAPSQKDVSQSFNSWKEEPTLKKTGLGHHALCDPIQTGQIVNDLEAPVNRTSSTIYRYTKAIRGCDEAMQDLFKNIVVIDDEGKAHPVPIMIGTQERAVAVILQDNVRQSTGVVDRPRLPLMAIHNTNITFNQDRFVYQQALNYGALPNGKPKYTTQEIYPRDTVFGLTRGLPLDITYTLYIWSKYVEDMNQIVEQIFLKFSPVAYIRVRTIPWETIVKLVASGNNITWEPGDQQPRVVKWQFDMLVETYLPQPITRKKAVLKTQVDLVTMQDDKVSEVLSKLEDAVDGIE